MSLGKLKQGPKRDIHIMLYRDTVDKLDRIVKATGRNRTAIITMLIDSCDETEVTKSG